MNIININNIKIINNSKIKSTATTSPIPVTTTSNKNNIIPTASTKPQIKPERDPSDLTCNPRFQPRFSRAVERHVADLHTPPTPSNIPREHHTRAFFLTIFYDRQ